MESPEGRDASRAAAADEEFAVLVEKYLSGAALTAAEESRLREELRERMERRRELAEAAELGVLLSEIVREDAKEATGARVETRETSAEEKAVLPNGFSVLAEKYLSGAELTAEEEVRLRKVLRNDSATVRALADLSEVGVLLREWGQEKTILREVERRRGMSSAGEEERGSRLGRFGRILLPAAAAAAVLLAAGLFGPLAPTPAPSPAPKAVALGKVPKEVLNLSNAADIVAMNAKVLRWQDLLLSKAHPDAERLAAVNIAFQIIAQPHLQDRQAADLRTFLLAARPWEEEKTVAAEKNIGLGGAFTAPVLAETALEAARAALRAGDLQRALRLARQAPGDRGRLLAAALEVLHASVISVKSRAVLDELSNRDDPELAVLALTYRVVAAYSLEYTDRAAVRLRQWAKHRPPTAAAAVLALHLAYRTFYSCRKARKARRLLRDWLRDYAAVADTSLRSWAEQLLREIVSPAARKEARAAAALNKLLDGGESKPDAAVWKTVQTPDGPQIVFKVKKKGKYYFRFGKPRFRRLVFIGRFRYTPRKNGKIGLPSPQPSPTVFLGRQAEALKFFWTDKGRTCRQTQEDFFAGYPELWLEFRCEFRIEDGRLTGRIEFEGENSTRPYGHDFKRQTSAAALAPGLMAYNIFEAVFDNLQLVSFEPAEEP